MTIELYVMLALLSRTTSILNDSSVDQAKKDYVSKLCKLSFSDSRRRFVSNLKGMTKNKDKMIKEISEMVVQNGGYGLDIIDY